MSENFEGRSSLEAELEKSLTEVADLATEEITAITKIEEETARLPEGSKRKEVLKKTRNIKEAIFFYTRLIVLGGLLLTPAETSSHDNETPEQTTQRAKIELSTKGITSEQEAAYTPYINDALYKLVTPFNYDPKIKARFLLESLLEGRENTVIGSTTPEREDAWRLYLGLPQINKTFGISDYRPSRSTEEGYYYKIEDYFLNAFITYSFGGTLEDGVKTILEHIDKNGGRWIFEDNAAKVMGNFTFSKGQDEKGHYISYYDKWDLAVGLESDSGFLGKPFEIYDRVYYDPETFTPHGIEINFDKLKGYNEATGS